MGEIERKGQRLLIGSAYQARGYLLQVGEVVPNDPRTFDKASHPPRLIQLQKGEVCVALTAECEDQLLAKVERDGQVFACFLLPASYDVVA